MDPAEDINTLDLTEAEVSATYQRLVQIVDGLYYNGIGELLNIDANTLNGLNASEFYSASNPDNFAPDQDLSIFETIKDNNIKLELKADLSQIEIGNMSLLFENALV
jgi:hypothetical protein